MDSSSKQHAHAVRVYVEESLRSRSDSSQAFNDKDFVNRLDANFFNLYTILAELYGNLGGFMDQMVELFHLVACSWMDRPANLKDLDRQRENASEWYMSNKMVGGVCYVDRYAENLAGVQAKIPYFKELGLNYLHLMPLFDCPQPWNDGGYAVTNYHKVSPNLGTIDQLRDLATQLRKNGISLVLDMIFNHTSDEHRWAKQAAAGNPEYSAYYWIFPDRTAPDEFEKYTREVFPDDHRGSFIRLPDSRWVWSTFYHFQWDLNYSNPAVFQAMASELLLLSNLGVEVFRMDAVAFIWKKLNTQCESLPEAHKILRAFNCLCRIAAPSVLFKSEAIVHPDDVVQYVNRNECQLSYNPLQMALTWEALATRDVSMLSQALRHRHNLPAGCGWVNYVRSHDDVGWTFSDDDAAGLGIDSSSHRRFLNAFFVGRHPGSFARGMPFQDNPQTGDCRISGTTASLAGLETATDDAIRRILLAYSIAMSTGGIPLIYLGDEVGMTNDYSYINDPSHANDSRWINRPAYPSDLYAKRHDPTSIPGRVFAGIVHLINLRKTTPELASGDAKCFETANRHVLGYERVSSQGTMLCLANFSDYPEWIERDRFPAELEVVEDLIDGNWYHVRRDGLQLRAHQFAWLRF